jgi:hypothetical protein
MAKENKPALPLPPLPKHKPAQKAQNKKAAAKIVAQLPKADKIKKQPEPAPEATIKTKTAPASTVSIPVPTIETVPEVQKAAAPQAELATIEEKPAAITPKAPTTTASASGFIGGKPDIKTGLSTSSAPVQLSALITEEGGKIAKGLIWRIYNTKKDKNGKYKLVQTAKSSQLATSLPLGTYLVNLSWGRSHLTEKMDILSSRPYNHKFVLNAGGLRLAARHMDGSSLPASQVIYRIFSDERDQFGKRQLILDNAPPNKTIRLNAGIYHVQSTYGTVNGVIESDITVEAGKLTEAIINHTAPKVTFKLVNQPGGEALAGAVWRILSPNGKLIRESGGALPTHVLAAGDYTIEARYSGRTFARKVSIEPGEPVHVEIVIQ